MAKRHPRSYPMEFRQSVIGLARAGQRPDELVVKFELSEQTVRNWIKQSELHGFTTWRKYDREAGSGYCEYRTRAAKLRFRFEHPTPQILQVLMCVRVASALRAALTLLLAAHTTEMAVLFGTMDDFLADINFVDEIIEKGLENVTASQRKFFELYFADDDRTNEDLLERQNKINHNERRQKVQASETRLIGGDNPDRIKKIVRVIDDVFSGGIHGDYNSVMEVYGGATLETAH